MSEPEKYTLDRVLEIVRGHATALKAAAEGLHATEGKDPDMLAFVGECALKASEALWDIDGWLSGRCTIWSEGRVYDCLFAVPALVLAVRAAKIDPEGAGISAGRSWAFCQYQAEQIAGDLMAWVKAHEKDAEPATASVEGTPKAPSKTEDEQLMPMEAFEAMADALRPLALGLSGFEKVSPCFTSLVDESTDPETLTWEGTHLIDTLATEAAEGAKLLDEMDGGRLKNYFPNLCDDHLARAVEVVERVSWILYGASRAYDDGLPPASPRWGGLHAHDMARDLYNDLCAKYNDYQAAERVAIDKQYKDLGWIKQPNGEWHPTPEMLKEMEASS